MVEQYKIHHRIGSAMPTGTYELTRKGNRRAVTRYAEIYETDAGMFSPEQWRNELSKAIEADKESDVLGIIADHCREHCAWLHREADILDYAMEILASRIFLCGNENWKNVTDKVKESYFIFRFSDKGGGEVNVKGNINRDKESTG